MLLTGEILYYALFFILILFLFYSLKNTKNIYLQIIYIFGFLLFILTFYLKIIKGNNKLDNLMTIILILYIIISLIITIKYEIMSLKIDIKIFDRYKYFYLLLLFILITIIRNGWLADDIFITFKTMKNFINGYGLRWNIDERVQGYTHPLWLFLMLPFYYEIRCEYLIALALNILLSFSAVYLLYKSCKDKIICAIIIILLSLSKGFIDYSTSGLENSLSYFLIILFLVVFYNYNKEEYKKIFYLSLLTSLGILTRQDLILIFAPFYFFILKNLDRKKIYLLILGFSPFIIWEIFSVIYYGFPFPNTYYAKINIDLPRSYLIEHGLMYFDNFLSIDYAGAFLIFGFIVLFIFNLLLNKGADRFELISLVIGSILYILYIIHIGGDFMMARFFSVLIIASAFGIVRINFNVIPKNIILIIFIGLISLILICNEKNPLYVKINYDDKRIHNTGLADEKGYYFQGFSLMKILCGINGIYISKRDKLYNEKDFTFPKEVGPAGHLLSDFFAPTNKYLINKWALTDPLLARIKKITGEKRIGHFERAIPDGYIDSVKNNTNLIKDEKIARYYDRIRLITRGKIFDLKRFWAIIEVNLGLVKI